MTVSSAPDTDEVTVHLRAWTAGDARALDALMPLVYQEMQQLARRQLRRERAGHALDASALVHEAYVRLARLDRIEWQDRAHFLALAAQAMRRVLINHAEARRAEKRGGGRRPLALDGLEVASSQAISLDTLLTLDTALTRLAALDERQARGVACRFMGGMTVEETASVLGTSPATVKRDWTLARAWLNRELSR